MALTPASSHGADLAATNTWTGNQTAPAWIASGLTGATAASRYVGAVASGAPASGTFAIGDFTIDRTGSLYVCTVAGSPGTWVQVGGSVTSRLDYAEITADVTVTGTSAAAATTCITGASVAYDGSTRVRIDVVCAAVLGQVNCQVNLWEDATDIGKIGQMASGSGSDVVPFSCSLFRTPTAGSHTYTVKAWKSSGTSLFSAGAGGSGAVNTPAFLLISRG